VVHGSKQAKNVRGCVQIVTALKSLQMQANQEFQRTLFILNETLLGDSLKPLQPTSGLLQGWLDIGAIGHFIAVVLHLGWTNIVGLLFVNLYFYIFNQQRFRADEQ